ncbi:IS5/IS1182 family transposase, partial [Micrococcus luteus]|nr:IS5/IS1182 family transposase [Micrococcus luteus]
MPGPADGIWDQVLDALLVRADADGELDWSVAVDSRSAALTSTAPTSSAPQGALWNHKNLRVEPADHALAVPVAGSRRRSSARDGHGLPLVILCGPGQGGD